MSEEDTIPEDSTTSTSSGSEDSDSIKRSATDSLNSLLKNKDTDCIDTCMDMNVECEGEGKVKRRTCCSKSFIISRCACATSFASLQWDKFKPFLHYISLILSSYWP